MTYLRQRERISGVSGAQTAPMGSQEGLEERQPEPERQVKVKLGGPLAGCHVVL